MCALKEMTGRTILLWLAVLFLAVGARADELICDVCGEVIHTRIYSIEDRVDGKKKRICENCEQIKECCFICGMPVKGNFKTLMDGRYICARDAANVIESESDAKDVCKDVKDG